MLGHLLGAGTGSQKRLAYFLAQRNTSGTFERKGFALVLKVLLAGLNVLSHDPVGTPTRSTNPERARWLSAPRQ